MCHCHVMIEMRRNHRKERTLANYTFVITWLGIHELDRDTCRVQHFWSQFKVEALVKACTASQQLKSDEISNIDKN